MNSYLFCSPRSVGLVDYDDDEDDEDYKPPPRKQPAPDEDEETMESLRLKRRIGSKDKECEQVKKQRLGKTTKPKDSVFAALCSTLSHAVLPGKKPSSTVHTTSPTADGDKSPSGDSNQENEHAISRDCSDNSESNSDEEKHREKEPEASRSCSEQLHSTSDNGQIAGEDCSLVPPKSSPEMAVNGS